MLVRCSIRVQQLVWKQIIEIHPGLFLIPVMLIVQPCLRLCTINRLWSSHGVDFLSCNSKEASWFIWRPKHVRAFIQGIRNVEMMSLRAFHVSQKLRSSCSIKAITSVCNDQCRRKNVDLEIRESQATAFVHLKSLHARLNYKGFRGPHAQVKRPRSESLWAATSHLTPTWEPALNAMNHYTSWLTETRRSTTNICLSTLLDSFMSTIWLRSIFSVRCCIWPRNKSTNCWPFHHCLDDNRRVTPHHESVNLPVLG